MNQFAIRGPLLRSVVRIELRRTGALLTAAGIGLIGGLFMVTAQPPIAQYSYWSSSWAGAAGWLNGVNLVLGPVAATVSAWIGGREHRQRLDELLQTTPRPPAQRLLMTWAGAMVGATMGFVVVAALAVAAVLPAASSYYGGRWLAGWWLVLLGYLACSCLGFAAGRLVPSRLTAPAVGLLLYVGDGVLLSLTGNWTQLAPVAHLNVRDGQELLPWVAPLASVWLLAISATSVILAVARRRQRSWAAVGALAALCAAVPLSTIDRQGGGSWSTADATALESVCTSRTPVVCVARIHAGLLPDVDDIAQQSIGAASTVVPLSRAVEMSFGEAPPAGTLPLPNLEGQSRPFRRGVAYPEQVRQQAAAALVFPRCTGNQLGTSAPAQAAVGTAQELVLSAPADAGAGPSSSTSVATTLQGDPAGARAWMARYLAAADECDIAALAHLAQG